MDLWKVINNIKKKHIPNNELEYLRVRMLYHCYPNLKLLLNGDLVLKYNAHLSCSKTSSLPYNYTGES